MGGYIRIHYNEVSTTFGTKTIEYSHKFSEYKTMFIFCGINDNSLCRLSTYIPLFAFVNTDGYYRIGDPDNTKIGYIDIQYLSDTTFQIRGSNVGIVSVYLIK